MRVIAGTARRVQLISPKGLNTRPTSDRAKEGLFNILGERVRGALMLDVFCGSGAIGIEALSRGAEKVVFADSAAEAIQALKLNLAKTKLAEKSEIIHANTLHVIYTLAQKGLCFDIIFLDPPYQTELLIQTLTKLAEKNILTESGMIIAETDAKFDIFVPEVFMLESTRVYGSTKFLFLHYTGA